MITSCTPAIVSVRSTLMSAAGVALSVTCNVRGVARLVTVGVPEIAPLAVLSERPAGSVPLVSAHV